MNMTNNSRNRRTRPIYNPVPVDQGIPHVYARMGKGAIPGEQQRRTPLTGGPTQGKENELNHACQVYSLQLYQKTYHSIPLQ